MIKPVIRVDNPKSIASLPQTFDLKKIKEKREKKPEFCFICEDAFKKLLNKAMFCKRCGREVCKSCSATKRQLSKSDTTPQRICDKCDILMDNWELSKEQKNVLESAEDKHAEVSMLIGEIDTRKGENEERFNNFEKRLYEIYKQNET